MSKNRKKQQKSRLKTYLDGRGIKLSWLSSTTGVEYHRLRRIVEGSTATKAEVEKIGSALKIPTSELFRTTEPMHVAA